MAGNSATATARLARTALLGTGGIAVLAAAAGVPAGPLAPGVRALGFGLLAAGFLLAAVEGRDRDGLRWTLPGVAGAVLALFGSLTGVTAALVAGAVCLAASGALLVRSGFAERPGRGPGRR